MILIRVTVNGTVVSDMIEEHLVLADFLRDRLSLRGTRVSCDQGSCGACTVLLDGRPVTACLMFAFAADGAEIRTIEGVADLDGTLSKVQAAFHELGIVQCGFCTSGMVMLAEGFLRAGSNGGSVREWMNANICRCSGYLGIARAMAAHSADE